MRFWFQIISVALVLVLFQTTNAQILDNIARGIYSGVLTFINEFDRTFELLRGRQDFNSWFKENEEKLQNDDGDEYDFIIVGSGSAGCALANRLSEFYNWKIILLEAGIQETALMDIPLFSFAWVLTDYNWNYQMEEELPNFTGLRNNRMTLPRGKALGGSTAINYMIYTRGNPWDYDRLAADGLSGWSYKDVLPYYIKSEDAQNLTNVEYEYHGVGGYQTVSNIYHPVLMDVISEAGLSLGYPIIDYNAPNNSLGTSGFQATVRNGTRLSVANAFLWPVRERSNLKILTEAFVTKLLINETTLEAYGVEYKRKGKTYRVYATKEVVLSAGTFNSPKLLMLSGIGPKEDLEEVGIKCLKDLPVGKNMQDHLTFMGLPIIINETVTMTIQDLLHQIPNYVKTHTGPFTSLGGTVGLFYVKTEVAQADYKEDYPDFEIIIADGSLKEDLAITSVGLNIQLEIMNSLYGTTLLENQFMLLPMHIHPKSVGYLKLRSSDPYDNPILHGNFFTDPDDFDIKSWISVIRFVQKIINTTALQQYDAKLNHNKLYICEDYEFDTDDYWACAVKGIALTLHHQVGTARMGLENDTNSVVNDKLQVHGISKLRVADSSVFPRAIGAHMNAPSIMVGEKAGDIIKEHYGELTKSGY